MLFIIAGKENKLMKMETKFNMTLSVENMKEVIKIVEKAEKSIADLKEAIQELNEKKIDVFLKV